MPEPVIPDAAPPGTTANCEPDPSPVRWGRDPTGAMHAVDPTDAILSVSRGYTETLCGQINLPPQVEFEPSPSGALCIACTIGATADLHDPGRFGAAPHR